MATQTEQSNTEAPQPQPIKHHWVMTVQTSDGRMGTFDGSLPIVPGQHTRTSSYAAVRKHMTEQLGTENLTVLFWSLDADQL